MMVEASTSMFERCTTATSELHERTLNHPMVTGIGSGKLAEETFRFYLEQDYQFLLEFVRVLAIAASSAPDLHSMAQLSKLVTSTVEVEIDALSALYERFGGDPENLDAVTPAPSCIAYINHLLASVHERDLLVSFAATLPCHWGYHDIGLHLREAGLPDEPRYAAWIEEYASDEYGELVGWAIERFNELGSGATEAQRHAALQVFELSCRYELGFWEMAWTGERWPYPDHRQR